MKSPTLRALQNDMAKQLGAGITFTEAIATYRCVSCGNNIAGFKDHISQKEYKLSGFCQECQDKTFDQ